MQRTWRFLLIISLVLLAGCGGNNTVQPTTAPTSAAQAPTPTHTPLISIPTYEYVPPTAPPAVETASAATRTAAAAGGGGLDAQAVERGRGRYEALGCAACHGDAGEGVEGKGSALTTSTMSQEAFISFMRSGGSLGASHQYSTNRLSDSGGRNLYQYLLSLRDADGG